MGRAAPVQASRQKAAETGASLAAGQRVLDEVLRAQLDSILHQCAQEADYAVNKRLMGGNNPSRQQCAEEVIDAQGNPLKRAILLGREKHQAVRDCVQHQLSQIIPGSFSLNARYRFDLSTGKLNLISPSQEKALLRAGGEELVGTLVPDVVLHTGNPLKVLDVYDFKFPCPGSNSPTWNSYPEHHPYHEYSQWQMYQKAFGGNPARVAPRWGVLRGQK